MPNMYGHTIRDPAGYCALHHFAMSVADIRKRDCIGKHCHHMRRMPHRWWEQRREQKAMRAERKRRKAEVYKMGGADK